jgi:pimeloyl-ACP methyl ester carboxylesterase
MSLAAPIRATNWRLTTSANDVALYTWSNAAHTGGPDIVPPLVLIHGLGDSVGIWHDVVAALSNWPGNILAVDLPGHGRADSVAGGTTRDMAERVMRLLGPVLRGGRFRLAGHSLGADVALHLATGPLGDRLDRLALLDFVGRMPLTASSIVAQGLRQRQAEIADASAYGDWLAMRLPFASDTVLRAYARRCFDTGAGRLRFNLATLDTPHYLRAGALSIVPDFDARLARASCDIAILHAALSGLLDRETASRTAERHGARLVTIPRAGHALCLDNPVAVAEGMFRFMGPPSSG